MQAAYKSIIFAYSLSMHGIRPPAPQMLACQWFAVTVVPDGQDNGDPDN